MSERLHDKRKGHDGTRTQAWAGWHRMVFGLVYHPNPTATLCPRSGLHTVGMVVPILVNFPPMLKKF